MSRRQRDDFHEFINCENFKHVFMNDLKNINKHIYDIYGFDVLKTGYVPDDNLKSFFNKYELYKIDNMDSMSEIEDYMSEVYDNIEKYDKKYFIFISTASVPRKSIVNHWIKEFKDLCKGLIVEHKYMYKGNVLESSAYYQIIRDAYDEESFKSFIDYFEDDGLFYGYFVDPDKVSDFIDYFKNPLPSSENIEKFKASVVGFFTGFYEIDLMMVLLK